MGVYWAVLLVAWVAALLAASHWPSRRTMVPLVALALLSSHAWGADRAATVALEATAALAMLEIVVYVLLSILCEALVWVLDHERG